RPSAGCEAAPGTAPGLGRGGNRPPGQGSNRRYASTANRLPPGKRNATRPARGAGRVARRQARHRRGAQSFLGTLTPSLSGLMYILPSFFETTPVTSTFGSLPVHLWYFSPLP